MAEKQNSLISVILPVHNCERYLAQAIESVLAQDCCPVELIVVDDGSTDRSGEIARRFGSSLRYVRQSNAGAGAARNHGVALATGDYFAFLDSDDLWVKDKLKLQMAAFSEHPDVDIVSGHVSQFYSPDLSEHLARKLRCPDELIPGHVVGAMLIDRNAFSRVGLFETQWDVGEVIDWYARAVEKKLRMIMLPTCVYMRRLHESNKGITHRQFQTQRIRILKAHLDRNRKSGIIE